jgi:hypothetical protein
MPTTYFTFKALSRLLFVAFLVPGCVAGRANNEHLAIARSVFGPNEQSYLYYVQSSGPIADATFLGLSSVMGPSKAAKNLAEILTRGEAADFRLAVAGD